MCVAGGKGFINGRYYGGWVVGIDGKTLRFISCRILLDFFRTEL